MFTRTTRSGHSHLYLALVIFSLWAAVTQGQVQKQCAAFNEYCQNHWDCCSNSCMSYLYRCTRNYGNHGNFFPYEFFGISSHPLQGTLEDIIELNFGNSIQQRQPQQPQRPAGFPNRFSEIDMEQKEVEQTTTSATASSTTSAASATTETPEPSTTFIISTTMPSKATTVTEKVDATTKPTTLTERSEPKLEVTMTSINSRQAEITSEQQPLVGSKAAAPTDAVATETTTVAAMAACREIGAKCYNNDECCTKRCHGFLHQCVT